MAELKEIDDVAYVRFASVYRDFQDIEAFKAELENFAPKVCHDDLQGKNHD